MRIVVLGGGGLLGHKMFQRLRKEYPDTYCTLRGRLATSAVKVLTPVSQVLEGVDVSDWSRLRLELERLRPDALINCVGVVKQRDEAQDAVATIETNSLLPHRLAALVSGWGGRCIHFSTDCVFSGRRGAYRLDDSPDAEDLYGRSKLLGEVGCPQALTLRTSFIGRELSGHRALLDWFLARAGGKVQGYRRAWWSGVTSNHLADVVAWLLKEHPGLCGTYQLSSGRISKYDLLVRLREGLGVGVEIEPDDRVVLDRTLDGASFVNDTGYVCPDWDALIAALRDDPTPYPALTPQG